MAKFKFEQHDDGYAVVYRGRNIGDILPAKESSGRHCFTLHCDDRKEPRTYRGMEKAAEALLVIDKLLRDARKGKWSQASLITRAWDARPRSADNF